MQGNIYNVSFKDKNVDNDMEKLNIGKYLPL